MDLITLADQVGAVADLDDKARDQFTMEMDFGDTSCAIGMAVLNTHSPLPANLLAHVLQRAPGWYAAEDYRQLVIDAATRQLQQQASAR